ncbi:MAG: hypothetical protein IT165_24555 [Bryobacterales bacterium]|nr:hypothetical protein [Bryobacterales bacterium]
MIVAEPAPGAHEQRTKGSVIGHAQGNQLLLLTTEGEPAVAEASSGGYNELRRYIVADTSMWTHPGPFGEGFFIKDETLVALWR